MWRKSVWVSLILICMKPVSKFAFPLEDPSDYTSECAMKFQVLKTHSACVRRSGRVSEAGLSVSTKRFIVNQINKFRNETNPPACNMLKMFWDDEVAAISQRWSEGCKLRHDSVRNRYIPGRFPMGQIIATGFRSWKITLEMWHRIGIYFYYGSSKNDRLHVIHYTQMISAQSVALGCGYAKCDAITFFVCNFGPRLDEKHVNFPYQNCTFRNQIYDCGNNSCGNEGRLNHIDCTCSCLKYKFITGKSCSLWCHLAEDYTTCSNSLECFRSVNVTTACPNLCGVCPYGSADFNSSNMDFVLNYFAALIVLCLSASHLII